LGAIDGLAGAVEVGDKSRSRELARQLVDGIEKAMKTTAEKAAEALELLPEDLRETAVAYLLEQAEKFRVLKGQVTEGLDDVAAGRVSEWNFDAFLRQARSPKVK
jgi:hypothetical protein